MGSDILVNPLFINKLDQIHAIPTNHDLIWPLLSYRHIVDQAGTPQIGSGQNARRPVGPFEGLQRIGVADCDIVDRAEAGVFQR